MEKKNDFIFEILYAAPVGPCGRNDWHVQEDEMMYGKKELCKLLFMAVRETLPEERRGGMQEREPLREGFGESLSDGMERHCGEQGEFPIRMEKQRAEGNAMKKWRAGKMMELTAQPPLDTVYPEIVNMVLVNVEVHGGGLLHFYFLDGTELEIDKEE